MRISLALLVDLSLHLTVLPYWDLINELMRTKLTTLLEQNDV
jgi:hypothetical protein